MPPRERVREHARVRPPSGAGAGVTATRVTDARALAAQLLADMRAGQLLDGAFERRATSLDPRDRRWVQELVWGMLRSRAHLDALIDARVRGGLSVLDDEVLDLLRLGAYQLLRMDSVPAYAAIGETVELVKRRSGVGASGLVNAVLRRIDRERDALGYTPPADALDALAETHSHPRWVVARWVARFGVDETARLLAANNTLAPITVRGFGITTDALREQLATDDIAAEFVDIEPDSLRLPAGVPLTSLAAFQQGTLYVQDAAASLVVRYAHVPEGCTAADLCAAPGSKALELSRRAAFVIAADRNIARVSRMMQGFARLHTTRLAPMIADARHPACAPVDAVLVDAPCTGTGTFRRHPDARWRLKASDFAVLGMLQKEILRGAATIVKPGGLLVYSTCSLEQEENEQMVSAFLAAHPEFTLEAPPAGTVPDTVLDGGYLRVLPHRHGTDGAFAARLRRAA